MSLCSKNLLVALLACVWALAAYAKIPEVPSEMVFAAQKIELERQDLRERMDRELINFYYSHINSTMILKRSHRYFSIVEPILEKEGVPEDFKYLMVIESNLDPAALSPAGAAGLWQMLKASAQKFGLEVGPEVDERYDVEKETVAACKYLKEAYAKYGDWLTVAASYNAGTNGISRRIESQRQSSALNLLMPDETMRYIFRILAAKIFFASPSDFGFSIHRSEYYPALKYKKVVEVKGPIANLTDFAFEHGTSYLELKQANLWLRSDHLTNAAGRSYMIAIP